MPSKFEWDRPTITGAEIASNLVAQYGAKNLSVSVMTDDENAQISYKSSLVTVHCNRCGAEFGMSPQQILNAVYTRGYVCSECGSMTNEQIRDQQKQKMLEAGAKLAAERGINLEDEVKKADEKKSEESSLGYTEDDLKDLYGDQGNHKEEIRKESAPVVQPSKPIPEPVKQAPVVEAHKPEQSVSTESADATASEDDIKNYEFDDDDDKMSLASVMAGVDENQDMEDEEPEEPDSEPEDDEASRSVESVVANEKIAEKQVEEAKKIAQQPVTETKTESEPETDKVVVCGRSYTDDQIRKEFENAESEIVKKIGFFPYERRADVNDDGFVITCRICKDTFVVKTIDEIVTGVTALDRNFCSSHSIPFKTDGGKIEYVHYCPHCTGSIGLDGYNKFFRKMVETTCQQSNLTIVNPEKNWFGNFKELITVEANGVEKTLPFSSIITDYSGKNAKLLPDFAPRGNGTKSDTAAKERSSESFTLGSGDAKETKNASSGFMFNPADQCNTEAKDSNATLNFEKERQNAAVDEANVFQLNQKVRDDKHNIAKLSEKLNPFERAKSLESSFQRSVFASFISELSEETKVECSLTINDRTFEVPVVDFECGIRIICVDIDVETMTRLPYDMIAGNAPFAYRDSNGQPIKNPAVVILYSDAVQNRRDALMDALVKYINPSILPYKGKKIELTDTIFTQYTDYGPYLKEFDTDYSTYPAGKPKTGQLGIIANWTYGGEKPGLKDMLKMQAMFTDGKANNLAKLSNDYDQYMVASIKYIERYNENTGKVVYIITDYVEIGSAIIADGLLQCIRALLREYEIKYPKLNGVAPHITMELDPDSIMSPSVKGYIEKNTLVPMDDSYRAIVEGVVPTGRRSIEQHLKYNYVRKSGYRDPNKKTDWYRQDMRMFYAGTIVRTMANELKTAGISNGIRDENTRLTFIANMGFTKCNKLETKEYFVNQAVIASLLMDGKTFTMQKMASPDQLFTTSGMVSSSGDGFNINSIMSNPILMQKYYNIMQNGTPEAKDYFVNRVMGFGNQQYNPMMGMQQPGMGMGMNPMMNANSGMPNFPNMNMGGMQMPMMGMGMPF